MAAGKELLAIIEEYAKQQKPMFEDSTEIGYAFQNEEDKTKLRQALLGLMESCMYKVTKDSGPFWQTSTTKIYLQSGKLGKYDEGTYIKVKFYRNDKWGPASSVLNYIPEMMRNGVQYVSIKLDSFHIKRDRETKQMFKDQGFKNVE